MTQVSDAIGKYRDGSWTAATPRPRRMRRARAPSGQPRAFAQFWGATPPICPYLIYDSRRGHRNPEAYRILQILDLPVVFELTSGLTDDHLYRTTPSKFFLQDFDVGRRISCPATYNKTHFRKRHPDPFLTGNSSCIKQACDIDFHVEESNSALVTDLMHNHVGTACERAQEVLQRLGAQVGTVVTWRFVDNDVKFSGFYSGQCIARRHRCEFYSDAAPCEPLPSDIVFRAVDIGVFLR